MVRLINILFTILMLALGLWLFQATTLPTYPAWLLTLSIITFLTYGFDKAQSKRKGWRVSEMTLHILAVAGGFLGGWLGMFWFRHKTRHGFFKVILFASTALHLYLLNSAYSVF